MADENILQVKGITKRFPGVLALDNVSFALKRGEVHAIVGENGAGKSTLMHILGGLYKQNGGQVLLEGKRVAFSSPVDAQKHGISIVFQELSLTAELSVAENIFVNRQPKKLGLIDHKKLFQKTRTMLDLFSENIDPKTPIKFLTIAKQQVVEILKALSHDPKVLILDEPTSSLTQVETKKLFENIRILKERGISIIYISHHLQEVFEIADRATVLRDGKYVDTVNVADVDEDKIVSMMVGREVTHNYVSRQGKIDGSVVVLEAQGLTHAHLFHNISFQVHKGEILGFAGLIGAGRTEMARAIFGHEKLTAGRILLNGRPISVKSPTDAMRQGIAYTSENRKLDGLFLSQSIEENCVSPQLKEFAGRGIGFLDEKRMEDFTKMCIDKFNITTPSMKQRVRNLSGGNQQKVLLSMWLGIQPKVLIVDEPTKGVDVGAKAEIYDILRALADTGVAIIVISSELLEVLTISDRIIVMKSGRIAGIMNNSEATEENVIAYATGAARA